MKNLAGSVGKMGANLRSDVSLVQTLLNGKASPGATLLKVDGVCGGKTIAAIMQYQVRALHIHRPDGLVAFNGPTWKHLNSEGKPLATVNMQSNGFAHGLVNEPAIKAMLEVIAFSEGTGDEYGTLVHGTVVRSPLPQYLGKRNVIVTEFRDHPNILVQVNAKLQSTAAGRYQFLHKTWVALRMPNFTPASQDIAAVKLFQQRHMVAPLLAGDFDLAVQRGSPEWASLPDASRGGHSHYGGQPARSLTALRNKYTASLGLYAGR